MRKTAFIALLAVACAFLAHAEDGGGDGMRFAVPEPALADQRDGAGAYIGVSPEFIHIARQSEGGNYAVRQAIYDSNKKDLTAPLLLNLFLGFGIGSFGEGDTLGGVIGLVGELSGLTLYILGSPLVQGGASSVSPALLVSGLAVLLGTRIFEIVRPITYTNRYNGQLRRAAFHGYGGSVSVGIAPAPGRDGSGFGGITASASILL